MLQVVRTIQIIGGVEGGVPVEFSLGIAPQHYPFEMVRRALGRGTEALKAGEGHCLKPMRRNSRGRFSLDRRLRCPMS